MLFAIVLRCCFAFEIYSEFLKMCLFFLVSIADVSPDVITILVFLDQYVHYSGLSRKASIAIDLKVLSA